MPEKDLIVVESPAKSHTISRFIGKNYLVAHTLGHLRDLKSSILSIDVENDYKPYYEEITAKKNVIADLRKLAGRARRVLIASDQDREGEAIAFHLQEILKNTNPNILRILFNEITHNSISAALKTPLTIDMNKVFSQQMRRLLDRLAGYKISPLLQKKIGGPLSAGRVQSIALKIIVEREKEIRAFKSEEYWTIQALLSGSLAPSFIAKLEKISGRKAHIPNETACKNIQNSLGTNDYLLDEVKKRVKKKKAPPPLITSTLQQEAFRRFKMPVRKTMQIAQQLYEGIDLGGGEITGLITYMRTDSFRVSEEGLQAAREWISTKHGPQYLPQKPNIFRSKGKIQDAHEAIRPTIPLHDPSSLKNRLNTQQAKIYELIWNRFLASQMKEAEIDEVIFNITNGPNLLQSKGETIRFPGFLLLLPAGSEDAPLPPVSAGEILRLEKLESKQNFTAPPARYSEASLVKVLEEKGIGRPSTYATIIETLNKRAYVIQHEKRFQPTSLGETVYEFLEKSFAELLDYQFTAKLEKELDQVAEGKLDWVRGIDGFYKKLQRDLDRVDTSEKMPLLTGQKCPKCGKDLVRKYSAKTRGWFIGCSGYPECRHIERSAGPEATELPADQILERTCPQCNSPLLKRYSRKTKSFFIGCSAFPKCNFIEQESALSDPCPLCQSPLQKKYSKKTRRHFIGCSAYPDCSYIDRKKTK